MNDESEKISKETTTA